MRTRGPQPGWRILPLALLLGLAGCSSETLTGPDAVEGGVWKLQTLQRAGAATVTTVSQPERYTIEFRPDLQLDVKADCNGCSGPYTLSGSSLQVGGLVCTRVACPADSLDQAFLAVLQGAQTHGVKDDVLTITSTAGEMTLRR